MDDSILNSIKKMMGFDADYDAFDMDFIIYINSTFSVLHQIGASPIEGFGIEDASATWSDFLGDRKHVNFVKTYMYSKIKLMFDPPKTSFGIEALKGNIHEFEVRLNYEELTFNPNAYDAVSNTGRPYVWMIADNEPFPEDMQVGDVAINMPSGKIQRKT